MKAEQRYAANPGGWIVLADFWGVFLKASIGGVAASLLVSAIVLAIA